MQKSFIIVVFLSLFSAASGLIVHQTLSVQAATVIHSADIPLPPDTGAPEAATSTATTTPATVSVSNETPIVEQTPPAQKEPESAPVSGDPERLVIPSISLSDIIEPVGLNSLGQMDVPSGKSSNVGWYKYGTPPGQVGSAVIDAHVFAAFANLNKLKAGDSIYVQTSTGGTLHFVISSTETYELADVPADLLFNRADTSRLNLITCAGQLTADHKTYDHRLVIYATLAEH